VRTVQHQEGAANANFGLHNTGVMPIHNPGVFCCCPDGFSGLQRLQQAVYRVLAAAVSWLFCCAGDLSGAARPAICLRMVSMMHTNCMLCVGLSWSLFRRYTSRIFDHNRGTNIVHIERFTVTPYELETLNAPSLKFRVHNKCTKDNCDTKTWCVE